MEQTNKSSTSKVAIVIGIVVVLIVVYFLVVKFKSTSVAVDTAGNIEGTYSIKDIMALDKPLQCTFVINNESSHVNGSVLVSGKNVRGDFDIEGTPVGSFASHFIIQDDISYTWTSLAQIGFKKAVSKSAGTSASPEDQASVVGIEDKVEYHCAPWNEDMTRFQLPSGINFQEIK